MALKCVKEATIKRSSHTARFHLHKVRDEEQISGCQGWIQGGLGSVGVVVNPAGKARGEFLW